LIDPLPIKIVALSGQESGKALVVDAPHLQRFVLCTFVSSASIGLIVSYLINHDILTSFFRYIGITRKTSRISIWSDVFNDITGWIVIAFSDGRRVRGWPRYFSDVTDDSSVYLERAQWLSPDGSPLTDEEEGLLITKDLSIQTISFLNPESANDSKRAFLGLIVLLSIPAIGFLYYIFFVMA
jgi:hypothetical protein